MIILILHPRKRMKICFNSNAFSLHIVLGNVGILCPMKKNWALYKNQNDNESMIHVYAI